MKTLLLSAFLAASCLVGIDSIYAQDCPELFSLGQSDMCNAAEGQIGDFVEGVVTTWDWGDGTVETLEFHASTHMYAADGTYEVCVEYSAPGCESATYCQEFTVEGCFEGCPSYDNFYAGPVEGCGNWVFEIGSAGDGVEVLWDFGDGSSEPGGHFADHHYEANGVYVMSASYSSPECPDGVEFFYTVEVGCHENPCPNDLVINALETCGHYLFEIPGLGEDVVVFWEYDGGSSFNGSGLEDITWEESGTYEVCAIYETPDCPSGVVICETVVVFCNEEACQLDLGYSPLEDCGAFIFEIPGLGGVEGIEWEFGDGTSEISGHVADHFYSEDGIYEVCAYFPQETCPEGMGVACATIEVNCSDNYDCPDFLWAGPGEGCGTWLFEIGSFVEGEEVNWDFGDGTTEAGGHFADHQYEVNGVYVVTAEYFSPLCPEGMTYTYTVEVGCYDGCETVFMGIDLVSDADLIPETIAWDVYNGDVLVESGVCTYIETLYCDVELCIGEGCHQIYLAFDPPLATGGEFSLFLNQGDFDVPYENIFFSENNNEATYEFSLDESCEGETGECPGEEDFYAGIAGDCGLMEFEIGSFQEGEVVFWYFGDETSETGGHYIQHNYTESGLYEVCVFFTSDACPEGVELCQEVWVDACDCIPVALYFDAVGEGAPLWLEGLISGSEGDLLEDFGCEYNDGLYCDVSLCLPEDCIEVEIAFDPTTTNLEALEWGVMIAEELVELFELEIDLEESLISFSFGVNIDCGDSILESEDAALSIFPNPSSGQINVQSTSATALSLQITDMAGRLTWQGNLNSGEQLSLHAFSPGMYLVEWMQGDQRMTQKLIVR